MYRFHQDGPLTGVEMNGPWRTEVFDGAGFFISPTSSYSLDCSTYENSFDWRALPTSNAFDLLQALAGLDDTIAMFGKKLAASASYGGYKWGWTPLMSDISAVNNAANRVKDSFLDGNRRRNSYNRTTGFKRTRKYENLFNCYDVTHNWDVKVKRRGYVEYENDILSFYDYLGFHPSPKVLWDIVPFSFALDWVLPIGDMLERISPPKGWVKAVNFSGWQVVTAKLTETTKLSATSSVLTFADFSASAKIVTRSALRSAPLIEQKIPAKPVELLKLPSLSQAFDIGYLANTFANGRKKR